MQASSSGVPYLFLFLTIMTTVNNEIAITGGDIQSAVLICSHFMGKRPDDSKLCRIASPIREFGTRELGLHASVVGRLLGENRFVIQSLPYPNVVINLKGDK